MAHREQNDEELRREQAQLRLLLELERALGPGDQREIVHAALRFFAEQAGLSRCSVALYRPDDGSFLVFDASVVIGGIDRGQVVPAGASALSEAVRSGSPLYRPDIAALGRDFMVDRLLLSRGVHADFIVPLRAGSLTVGTFNLGSNEIDGIGPEQRALAERAAPRLAAALDNALLLEALRESEARYRGYVEHAPMGVFVIDGRGRYLDANPRACELVGYRHDELVGMSVVDLAPPELGARAAAALVNLEQNHEIGTETELIRKDGKHIAVTLQAARLAADRFIGYVIDISEKRAFEAAGRQLEAQLQQAQKLESLGVLAGGIAHDFNNMLTSILGHADLARRQLDEQSPAAEYLEEIVRSSRQAAKLTGHMLAYSGRGRFVVEAVDINALLEEMRGLLDMAVSKRHRVVLDLSEQRTWVRGSRSQLQQVVMNFVINASEAMEGQGGCVAVRSAVVERDAGASPSPYLPEPLAAGKYVELRVEDSGSGMSAETAERLFDPFFSTKFTGRGLGLATVHGIVRGHHGGLFVDTEPGRGTAMRVLLPATREPERCRSLTPIDQPRIVTDGMVLLVDDERAVRTATKLMLEHMGLQVLVANSGRSGLALVAEHHEQLRLVLLDLTMPGLDGLDCARQIRAEHPTLPVAISSGFTETELQDKLDKDESLPFIEKPYTFGQLQARVIELLR